MATPATELADTLTRDLGLPFRTAHRIVSRLVGSAVARGLEPGDVTSSLLDKAAEATIGRPLGLSEEAVQEALDPVHFVAVRAQPGGPAPQTMRAWLDKAERALRTDQEWLAARQRRQREAAEALSQRVEALSRA